MLTSTARLAEAIARRDHEEGRCPWALMPNCAPYHREAAMAEAIALRALIEEDEALDEAARRGASRSFGHTGAAISEDGINRERNLLRHEDGTRYCPVSGHSDRFCLGRGSDLHNSLFESGVGISSVPGPSDAELAAEARADIELVRDEFHGREP